MCYSKIPNYKWVNNNNENIWLMTMIIMIITIEKGEAYHLVPKSILLLNIRVIWKVNTALDLVPSFELNNAQIVLKINFLLTISIDYHE